MLSIHTYTGDRRYANNDDPGIDMIALVQALQALMAANGDTVPLWITEFSWDSDSADINSVTEAQQAQFTSELMTELSSLYIPVAFYYNLVDINAPGSGLVRNPSFAQKPVYQAVQDHLSNARLVASGGVHRRRSS